MIHVFKIMNGMDRLDSHNFFTFPSNNTGGHSKKSVHGTMQAWFEKNFKKRL